jgi:hypothetical protein
MPVYGLACFNNVDFHFFLIQFGVDSNLFSQLAEGPHGVAGARTTPVPCRRRNTFHPSFFQRLSLNMCGCEIIMRKCNL